MMKRWGRVTWDNLVMLEEMSDVRGDEWVDSSKRNKKEKKKLEECKK